MRLRPKVAFLRRTAGRIAGVGLSIACLGASELVSPAVQPASGSARWWSGAHLSDDGIAVLPTAIRRVLADTSWLLAIQHYGSRRLEASSHFPSLGPLIDKTLRLDPGFRPAAVVGALLLGESPPFGAGEPQRADRILAEWLARHPGDFDAVLVRGLLHSWYLRDLDAAARILEAASARDGAPPWFTALTARSLTETGDRETARRLWRALLERADDGRTRSNASTHLLQLDALDQRDRLVAAVGEYERRSGRSPVDWNELIAKGLLPGRPVDPAGAPFVLDRDGMPRIARTSPLAGFPGR